MPKNSCDTEKPPFDVGAAVVKVLKKRPRKVIMSDGTFRAYYPDPEQITGEEGVEHFVFGQVDGRNDAEILREATQLLCGNSHQFYHEDGTPHVS